MKSEERSQAFLRKRKMMLALPILVVPFITLAFWANGGGQGGPELSKADDKQGLNLNLPDAKLNEKEPGDKLSFYDKAEQDSIKLAELMQRDPYFQLRDTTIPTRNELEQITAATANKYNQPLNTSPYDGGASNTEKKIMERLASLEKEMNRVPANEPQQLDGDNDVNYQGGTEDMDRLEDMLQMINQKSSADPEMVQIDNTLEKILDIQHPDRVKERIKRQSIENKDQVFGVSRGRESVSVSLFGKGGVDTSANPASRKPKNSFYSAENGKEAINESNAIEAVVHETQIITNGSIVKMRLLNDVFINGTLIPKDNFVFGLATLSGERLQLEIASIRYQNSLFPVKLDVFDLDGLEGIYIPGAITREVAKNAVDNSMQMMELTSMNPNLGVQAASAGINAAKNLVSRKVKLVKVAVKAGYKVLLRDDHQK